MFKKVLFGLMLLMILCLSSSFAVFGKDTCSEDATGTPDLMTQIRENIEEYYSDGHRVQSTYRSSINNMSSMAAKTQNTSEYLPDSSSMAVVLPSVALLKDHGRTQITVPDNRIGRLVCGYDSDNDGDVDFNSFGTASLQHYDIVISCAHCVWKPQYKHLDRGGWATTITFLAGLKGETYTSSSTFDHVAISTAYKTNSTYSVNEDGNIIESPDFNNDWCIITINDNLGGRHGWYGLHGCSSIENGMDIYTIGYPSDKSPASQWKAPGSILEVNGHQMTYSAYIVPGNSGGPLINSGCVYGIATYTVSNSTTGKWIKSGGTCMYDALFSMIMGARSDSEERWGNNNE